MVDHGKAFVPEVLYNGKYHPICGHGFWDDNAGTTTVCNLLGFERGSFTKTKQKYNVNAMPVGRCSAEEQLRKCTGGENAWGNFTFNNNLCTKGKEIGITITCDAGACETSHREHTIGWLCGRFFVCIWL